MQPQSDNQTPAPAGWQYRSENAAPTAPSQQAKPSEAVHWTASEFIAHQKGASWYAMLILAGLFGMVIIYFLTHDLVSTAMIFVVMVIMAVLAGRKPRTMEYQVDSQGIQIGTKRYPYANFKTYSIIEEGPISSITLMPLKRFMPTMSLYYDPKDEERITAIIGSYLPFVEGQKDAIDRLMHRIRF